MTQRLLALGEGVFLNWLCTFGAGMMFGPLRGKPINFVVVAIFINILASAIAFVATGLMHWQYGWPHFLWVGLFVWFSNSYNALVGNTTWIGWALSAIPIGICVLLGFLLARGIQNLE